MWNNDAKPEVVSAIEGMIFTSLVGFKRNQMLPFGIRKGKESNFEISEVKAAFKAILDGARAEGEKLGSVAFSSSDTDFKVSAIPEDIEILRNFAFGGIDTGFGKVCDISYSDPIREISKFIDRYMAGTAHGNTMSIDLIRYIPGEQNKQSWQIQEDMQNLCREKLGEADWREPNYKVVPCSLEFGDACGNKILIRIERTPEEIRESDAYKEAQKLQGVEITQKSSRGHFYISVSSEAGSSHRRA